MKNLVKLLIPVILSLLAAVIQAQESGLISYSKTIKMNIKIDTDDGIDLSDLMPDSRTINTQVVFDKNHALESEIPPSESQDKEINSDDGSFQIIIMDSGIQEETYSDFENKKRIRLKGFMGKAFVIESKIEKTPWKIVPEKLKYLGYECMKATRTNEEGKEIVAWFAPAITSSVGPGNYGQLPGAILMLSVDEDQVVIKATEVELKAIKAIKPPKKGKKVSQEEYDRIVEEKLEEMKNAQGKGEVIEIRG